MKELKFSFKKLEEGKKFVGDNFSNSMDYGPNFINKNGKVIELQEGDIMIKDKDGNISLKVEVLADIQHDIWAHWMRYMFSCGAYEDGNWIMPKDKVERWTRQMNTKYKDLSEKEQESDIDQANKFIHLFN